MTAIKSSSPHALLVDANFSSLPLFLALHDAGLRVSVCGNAIDDPCHAFAHHSFPFDYSDQEALLDLVQSENIDYLIPGCNDRSYLSSAWVAERLGFPGFDPMDKVRILHQKDSFRTYAQHKGYPVPRVAETLELAEKLYYPLLIKPVDSFSGRGMQLVTRFSDVNNALKLARMVSSSQRAIAEEFRAGSLHSHSAFIRNHTIIQDFFVDEYCTVYPYQVNSSCLSTTIDKAIRKCVRTCINDFISDLKLCDGLLHTQFILDHKDFWLIELCRRCPGDLYSKLIEDSTSFEYAKYYTCTFTARNLPSEVICCEARQIARHTVTVEQPAIFFAMRNPNITRQFEVIPLKKSGDLLRAAPYDKAGIYFLEFENQMEMSTQTPNLRDELKPITLEIPQ